MRLLRLLKPSAAQIRRLSARETDPAYYRDFMPIERGPLVALLLPALVGAASVVAIPFALVCRPDERDAEPRPAIS